MVHECRTSDQHNAVEAVMHVVTGHRRRPVVLISDRGRGKSSALGIAAARLLKAGKQQILVTAPSQKATGALFAQAARLLPGVEAGKGLLHLDQASIGYVAPDQLLQYPQTADLLLVDEAAAIPTPLLEALLDHYPRIAFATTVHGYEGTGRGFALRFRKVLEQRFPQWREVRLESPIRWAPGDPLEEWLFRALALNAAPAPDELIRHTQVEQCTCEALDRDRLVQHEADLTDLFGLLVLAHYRTTPFDLRHLLDGPNLHVFALRSRGRIVATALLAMEGGFDATTAHAIWAGYRRPRGHLLAQSLAAHVGLEDGACLCGGRIIRIAVHPVLQQRGLGSRLVQEILQFSQVNKLDYLGSSFGATTELLRFWGKNHFQPVRIGLRRSASSGAQSVIMLQPITPAGERIFDTAKARFQRQLPQLLADPLQGMDAELAAMLLAHSQPVSDLPFDAFDWLDLIGFAFAQRAYETCLTSLESLSLQALADSLPESAQSRLLVMRVVQHRDWTECARILQLAGRTAVETQLRRLVGDLILHYADATTRALALRIQAEALE
jgi:tRNA(Met) cytidine acetyltransferase